MNVQAHISGQISGQVPNQTGPQFPGLSQQNGNLPQGQMQNLGGQRNPSTMDPEFTTVRKHVQNKIYEFLMQKKSHVQEVHQKRIYDLVRRLEEGLLRTAANTMEYMNLDTLENRLHVLIRKIPMTNHTAQHSQFANSSAPIGTMIPTPGMQRTESPNLIVPSSADTSTISASGCSNISSSAVSSGGLLPTANGSFASVHGSSFHSSEGSMLNGYQQPSQSFSINTSGNSAVPSMGGSRAGGQMIPTPGFGSNNNQPFMNIESANSDLGVSSVDSSLASQQLHQKQHLGSQSSHVLQNLSSQIGGGMRSATHQRPYAFQNGSLNSGFGNNVSIMNGSGSSEGYLSATSFGNSSKPLQQRFDLQQQQQQRHFMQGDGYGLSTTDSSASGSLYNVATSVGPLVNSQNLNQVRMQSTSRSTSLVGNQSSLQSSQSVSRSRHQSAEQLEKSNYQHLHSSRDNGSPARQQQCHQQSSQLQPHQFLSHLRQPKQASQQDQTIVANNAFGRSQVASELGSVKPEPGFDRPDEIFQSQLSGQFQFSELQNHAEGHPTSSQFSSFPSAAQNTCSTLASNAPQMLLQHQLVPESQNEFNCIPVSEQVDMSMQAQWHHSEAEDKCPFPGSLSNEQQIQEEFHHRISGHDEAQRNNLPSEGSISGQTSVVRNKVGASMSGSVSCRSGNANRERQFRNQQRWLLFLRHARRCSAPPGKCQDANCITVQKLWKHMDGCNTPHCSYPRCYHSKVLINHNKQCKDPECPVCVRVRDYLQLQQKITRARQNTNSGLQSFTSGLHKSSYIGDSNVRGISGSAQTEGVSQPSVKRMKTELSAPTISKSGSLFLTPHANNDSNRLDVQQQEFQNADHSVQIKTVLPDLKMEVRGCSPGSSIEIKKDTIDATGHEKSDGGFSPPDVSASAARQENVKDETDAIQTKIEDAAPSSDHGAGSKSGKPKIKGVSLTELFTPEQVREHIRGLRQWVGQSKAKAEKNQAMEHAMSENSCQLCAVEKLTFEPPPIYCSTCGARIKRNAMYYTYGTGDTRHYFCIPCYNEARGDTIVLDGTSIPKPRLEKKKNDEETEEWWVQCDKCEAWQHQICALFNGRRNDGGQAEYTCPNCYIQEVEMGERKPLPQSAVLGAKDLPRTILSDHIEQRLFKKLKHERQDRAKFQGKSYEEVPGAEEIVVRVVSSVDKKLEVKPRFLEIFQEENYPTEFPYKSKVVLLFQKIEGVEVCLFGMYVQEFGSECQSPNHRRVYLSYLDSVKYFRPEVKTVTGEALRTYVYHEILIGYLEYCKKRGFTSCYIWACPPLKGEDYILYCHPEIQKTPKSDKLREWYLSMLRKAAKENIVADLTNMYDHFFVTTGECKAKVTASRLPYFDGDYWPGAAEDMIYQLNQEEDGRKQNKKGATKKTITKRALKASGHSDLSSNALKDLLLMHKLGETILPMKEDFIMVHLQHACTHCCGLMVSGNRWVCKQCKNFQLCDKCYEAEQKLDERERHPVSQKDVHTLFRIDITDVLDDTKDKDDILESEFFDTRQAFLSLCQGNHYQYDTLRRAKHSSMMVLYHLHNPTAPAFVTTCNVCHLDIETGQGWRCETCPDYDVCNACYQKEGGNDHPHKLTNHPSIADRDAQNTEARQLRVVQLRKMLDLLVHASQCRSPHCQYPNCRKVKGLFRHGIQCRTRASGGCVLCKKMWHLLQLHARACKESECHVPRCRDLKEHLRRLQQQSDSRRRAAVMEMMRQRAAEVAGNAG